MARVFIAKSAADKWPEDFITHCFKYDKRFKIAGPAIRARFEGSIKWNIDKRASDKLQKFAIYPTAPLRDGSLKELLDALRSIANKLNYAEATQPNELTARSFMFGKTQGGQIILVVKES